MRPGAVKVETDGSYWWFDEENLVYLRLPKEERPREDPAWGGPDAGILQDAVWHSYVNWEIKNNHDLIIQTTDEGSQSLCIFAPYAKVVTSA